MNNNNDNDRKRAPGVSDHDEDASKRIRSLMEAGRTQDALFLRAQLLEQHQPQRLYPTLDSAQQQLALAIARKKQSEEEVYLRQQEVQQAASVAELASRQHQQQGGVGSPALLDNHRSFSDLNRGMFSQMSSPGLVQQLSAGGIGLSYPWVAGLSQQQQPLLPWQNHLRLQSALAGMGSSMLGNYIGPTGVMDPFLLDAVTARTAGFPLTGPYGNSLSTRPTMDELRGFFGTGSVGAGAPVPTSIGEADSKKHAPLKTDSKPTKKKRASKKLDIPYTEYDSGDTRELSLPSDKDNLSPYQCILREQILLFSVQTPDIQCSAQGRNKPIKLGQVGVVCRHCARIPPGLRPSGAVYFPGKLSGLYQASQNMAINHFKKSCRSIPEDIRERLFYLKDQKSSVLGGGKHFWANGARVVGVYETEEGLLRFLDSESPHPSPKAEKEGNEKQADEEKQTEANFPENEGKQAKADFSESQKDDGEQEKDAAKRKAASVL